MIETRVYNKDKSVYMFRDRRMRMVWEWRGSRNVLGRLLGEYVVDINVDDISRRYAEKVLTRHDIRKVVKATTKYGWKSLSRYATSKKNADYLWSLWERQNMSGDE
ncbi:MAG: hypothetical protein QXU18_08700 [Thermoplasmatales archaeon]